MAAKKKAAPADVPKLVDRYLRAREAGKRAYARSDDLIRQIADLVAPGEKIQVRPGLEAMLVDEFADRLIVWNPCGARRWKVEVKVVAKT